MIDHDEVKFKVSKEIMALFEKNKIKMSEASGILGALLGDIQARTDESFPLISFLNSFTRTYSINYSGVQIHEVAGPKTMGDI